MITVMSLVASIFAPVFALFSLLGSGSSIDRYALDSHFSL